MGTLPKYTGREAISKDFSLVHSPNLSERAVLGCKGNMDQAFPCSFTYSGWNTPFQPECSSSAWKVTSQMLKPLSIFRLYVLYQTESSLEKPILEIRHIAFYYSLRACEKFCRGNSEIINMDFQLHKHHFSYLFSSLRTSTGGKNVSAKEQDSTE